MGMSSSRERYDMAAAPGRPSREVVGGQYPPAARASPDTQLSGEPHEQRGQALRQALHMIDHGVVVRADDAAYVIVGVGIEREAIGGDAARREFFHGLLGVGAEILRIAHVDVGGFAVADQEDELLLLRLAQ